MIFGPPKAAAPPSEIPLTGTGKLFGSGEMADRTRAFDWSRTSVGPIALWPEPLLITVNTLLANPHPMFLFWGRDLIQFYNDAYRRSLGSDKHPRALGQRAIECWPEIWPTIYPQIEQVMTTGVPPWNEDRLIPIFRNGRLEDVYWTSAYSPVRDFDGDICATLVTCTETTQRQLTEQTLRQELKRLCELFEQAPAFFTVLRGPDHVFERVNPLYQKLLGPRSLLGKPVREVVPEAEDQGVIAILDTVYRTGEPYIGRDTPIKLDRTGSGHLEERILDFVYQPLREPGGEVSGIIVLGIDVTESKRAQQVLLQTEKLAAVGRLASSIAHEINNPLEAVTNLVFLAQETAIHPETKEYLSAAEIELRRVSAIANQTLRFHKQATNPRPATANDLIASTLPIYSSRMANSRIEVQRRDRAVAPIRCFEGEIRQVLSNLVGNAIDAMASTGGRLLVRSREATDWNSGAKGIVFTVADTGSGLDHNTASRIFEPFFTTKGFSGTGLGLWVSKTIVERHQGVIAVRSSRRQTQSGAVFTVFLPFHPNLVDPLVHPG